MGFKSPEAARGNSTTTSGRRRAGCTQSPNTRMNIEKYLVPQVKPEVVVVESDSKSDIASAVSETQAVVAVAAAAAAATAAVRAGGAANTAVDVSVGSVHQTSGNTVSNSGRQKENVPETEASTKARKRVRTSRKRPNVVSTTTTGTKSKTSTAVTGCIATPATTSPNVVAGDSKEKFITDYFQPRRSHRRTKAEVIKSKQLQMEEKIIREDESGFEIVKYEDKGRGVISMIDLKAGDFVLEYAGDLINLREARRREEQYANDTSVGCYMYYFQHDNGSYCVDATPESTRLGRLINHSIKGANLKTRSVKIGGKPRLIFLAKRDIRCGEELLYDYGDRSKLSLQSHPWLKK